MSTAYTIIASIVNKRPIPWDAKMEREFNLYPIMEVFSTVPILIPVLLKHPNIKLMPKELQYRTLMQIIPDIGYIPKFPVKRTTENPLMEYLTCHERLSTRTAADILSQLNPTERSHLEEIVEVYQKGNQAYDIE